MGWRHYRAILLSLLRLVRLPHHQGQLPGRISQHQDSHHAGMVDARAPARRICSSCDRIHFSHVPTIRGRDRPAGRRGFSSLNAWHHGRRGVIMTWQMASLLLLGGSTVLLFAGMPVAISFIAINLMGEVLFHTGLALKVIDGVERLIRQVPGRLAVVAVVAGTIFSAISGSTIATTAMLGSLMLPVMLSRGYNPVLATGPIMAIGAVDMLIP